MFILKPSFAAGELSPALYGRTDLAKYDVGAANLTNFLVLRYGGIKRRPGLKYIAQTDGNKPARLIPFSYSKTDSYVIEITAGKFRFYRDGQLLNIGVANDFSESDLPDIKYTQSADVVFLTHPNHHPMVLTRQSATSWTYSRMDISAGPFEDANVTSIKISASAVTGNITLTSSAAYFTSDMVGQLIRIGHTMKSQYVKAAGTTGEVLCPPQATVYVETFGFWTGNIVLQRYDDDVSSWVDIRSQNNNHQSNYNFTEKNTSNSIKRYRVYSSDFDPSVWEGENEKQTGYITLQCFAQGYYGIVKITGITDSTHATGTVQRRIAETSATNDFALSAWSNSKGYPTCVGFFEDRIVFAGSKKQPQSYWLSKTGDYFNFDVTVPQQDDDAITGTLNNGQMNGIKAIVAFGELLLLTAGGEYKLSGGSNAMTPTNQQAKAQEYRGINNLTPIVCGSRIIYVQSMGSIVRDLGYQYDQDKYTGDDVSLLASHLFEGHTIINIAYQQTPNSILWCVREDGVLLGMTYIKEQDVYAWHKHTTQGKFKDVCCIAGENEDKAYFLVERDGKYYVELMASQIGSSDEKVQYYVDSYSEANNASSINGLDRLNNKIVQILADGDVWPERTITGGTLDFGSTYSKIITGLGYTSELDTMPIEFNGNDGSYQSRKKRLSKLMIMFRDSRGGNFGIDSNRLDKIKWRSNENYNTAVKLYSGKKEISVPSTWTDTLSIIVMQKEPLPLSILSIVPEIQAGG